MAEETKEQIESGSESSDLEPSTGNDVIISNKTEQKRHNALYGLADSSLSSDSESSESEARCKPTEKLKNGFIAPKIQHYQNNISTISPNQIEEEIPMFTAILTYFSYGVMVLFGYLREFTKFVGLERNKNARDLYKQKDFVPLYSDFQSFYTRHIYRRLKDCMDRPICSVPGGNTVLMDRKTDDYGYNFEFTGNTSTVVNMGSYNYLGFAQNDGPCADACAEMIDRRGVGTCSSRHEMGNFDLQTKLETLMSEFLGVESCICFPMGFATNSMNLPSIVSKGCLIISDELNHASLILGCRLSGAHIRVFKHNNTTDLELKLRDAIIYGQPRTHRPYKKILIVIEGIYSMEGSICNLREIIKLKKKYNTYLYMDEAHSIGAMGHTGRGICEYWGCDPKDVDILMGTFTKSFASAGGYIAGTKKFITHLRIKCHSVCYGGVMSPCVIQQIISTINIIMGRDRYDKGKIRIERLIRNTRYFRQRLKQLGFTIYGNDDSPVVPCLIYVPSKVVAFSRLLLDNKIGVVIAGFPATPITLCRARFCVSAQHTKEQLDEALETIDKVGEEIQIKYSRIKYKPNQIIDY